MVPSPPTTISNSSRCRRRTGVVWVLGSTCIIVLCVLVIIVVVTTNARAAPSSSSSSNAKEEVVVTTAPTEQGTPTALQLGLQLEEEELNGKEVLPVHPRPLNVVLFYTDDWNANNLGLVNPLLHTPHLNQLAVEGQWFPHSYVTSSVCWQSRATLLTGMYVSVHQFVRIQSQALYGEVVRWTDTLWARLKSRAGYAVGFVGKWHAPLPNATQEAQAFDYFREYYGQHWMKRNGVRRHVTELNQADALEFLQQQRRSNTTTRTNFALMVSFYATHDVTSEQYPNSYMPQPYTADLYNSSVHIPRPFTATENAWNHLPWFFTEENLARQNWHQRGLDVESHRQETMKRIYRMASEVDDAVGAIVAELKEQGVYNDTLIIFTADNGSYQGEYGLAGKWYTHDESIRVPLILRDPRMPVEQRGRVNDHIALNIDLAPTILAAAGLDIPVEVQGRDLAQLYLTPPDDQDNITNWRQDFFYEWNQGSPVDAYGHGSFRNNPAVFALIQKDWKYIYWPQTDYEQLFDLVNDPNEMFDVLNKTYAENRTIYNELKKRYALLKNASQSGLKV